MEKLLVLEEATKARIKSELRGDATVLFPPRVHGVSLSDYPDILGEQRESMRLRQQGAQLRIAELKREQQSDFSVLAVLSQEEKEIEFRLSLTHDDVAAARLLVQSGSGSFKALRESLSLESTLRGEIADVGMREIDLKRQAEQISTEIDRVTAAARQQDEDELYRVSSDEQDTLERLDRAILSINRAEIKSPVSGQIINLNVHTLGGVAAPGATLLEIVPSNTKLIIEAKVRPVDIDGVAVGSNVIVRPEGTEAQRVSELSGRVTSVSADRILDHATGEPYFLITADVDPSIFHRRLGRSLRPGIALDLMIRKPDSTFAEYIFSPLILAWSHALRD
jgi:epimerase transport system membrane fusion protein